MTKKEQKQKIPVSEPITRQATLNLHKRLHKQQFKKKAPKALKQVREFAREMMKTDDIRIDMTLNKFLWSQGIRNPPRRVRIQLERKKNEDEDAQEAMYTIVSYVPVASFKGLNTVAVSE